MTLSALSLADCMILLLYFLSSPKLSTVCLESKHIHPMKPTQKGLQLPDFVELYVRRLPITISQLLNSAALETPRPGPCSSAGKPSASECAINGAPSRDDGVVLFSEELKKSKRNNSIERSSFADPFPSRISSLSTYNTSILTKLWRTLPW